MKRVLLPVSSFVTHLSGEGNYTFCHLIDGKKLLISKTLAICLDVYPSFIRIHRTYAINPDFLDSYRRPSSDVGEVHLAGVWLPVGRRRLSSVFKHVKRLSSQLNN
ncbi:LytTR family DNA-binding domain-containing protein [Spirosoma pollinicola]|uniref:HTH LytTR-type domain-containing protein n=1 Tax=Spirosoma pollinicola TaxID=2057025 RepID=A0A2K8YZ43_9BACT|nr:hypothetical protein CWM47_14300 [Spirosoma pollinicola]